MHRSLSRLQFVAVLSSRIEFSIGCFSCFEVSGECNDNHLLVWKKSKAKLIDLASGVFEDDKVDESNYGPALYEMPGSKFTIYSSSEGMLVGGDTTHVDVDSVCKAATRDKEEYIMKVWSDCHETLQKVPEGSQTSRFSDYQALVSDPSSSVTGRGMNPPSFVTRFLSKLSSSSSRVSPMDGSWGQHAQSFSDIEKPVKDYVVTLFLNSKVGEHLVTSCDAGTEHSWVPRIAPLAYQISRKSLVSVRNSEWFKVMTDSWGGSHGSEDFPLEFCGRVHASRRLALFEHHQAGSVRSLIEEPGFNVKTIWTLPYVIERVAIPLIEKLEVLHHLGILHGKLDEDALVFVKPSSDAKVHHKDLLLTNFGEAILISESPAVHRAKSIKSINRRGVVEETLLAPSTPWGDNHDDDHSPYSPRDDVFLALEIIANFLSYPDVVDETTAKTDNSETDGASSPVRNLIGGVTDDKWADDAIPIETLREKSKKALLQKENTIPEESSSNHRGGSSRVGVAAGDEDEEKVDESNPNRLRIQQDEDTKRVSESRIPRESSSKKHNRNKPKKTHTKRISPYRAALISAKSFDEIKSIKSHHDMFQGCCEEIELLNDNLPPNASSAHTLLSSIVEHVRSLRSPDMYPNYILIKKRLRDVMNRARSSFNSQLTSITSSGDTPGARRRARFDLNPVSSVQTFDVADGLNHAEEQH